MKDYREKEMKQLLGVLLLLCIYYCTPVFKIISKSSSFFNEFVSMVKYIISLGVISLCVFLFDCLITSEMKNKLVGLFCIPMAGEVIFTKIFENKIKDKRFTYKEARKRYDDIILNRPQNTQEKRNYENACWFSIYQKYKNDGAVVQSQKDFLTCRDLFSEIVLFAIMYLISIVLFKSFIIFSWEFIFILVALGTVINCSTHVKMNRFVNSVIAIDIAKGEK